MKNLSKLMALGAVASFVLAACGAAAPTPATIIKEVIKEVPKEVVVTKEVIKEVPKDVVVTKEVPIKKTVVRVTGFVSSPAETNLLKGLMYDFMTKNPDIEVKYEPIADDYGTKIKAQLASGDAADLFYVDVSDFPFFANKGLLAPLDDQMAKNGVKKEDFAKGLVDAFTSQGKLYGIAKDFNTLALFYNKDLFKKAGIPEPTNDWKWDDLKTAAAKLTNKAGKVYGFGVPPDAGRFPVFVMQAGGTNLMTADLKDTTLDSPEALIAAQFYTDLRKDGSAAFPNKDLGIGWQGEAFGKGNLAMVYEGGWMIPYLKEQFSGLNYGAVELPAGPKGKANLIFTVAWGLNSKSKVQDAAFKVMNYLTSIDAQTQVLVNGLALPSRVALTQLDALKKDPVRSVIFKGAEYGKPFFYGEKGGTVLENTGKAIEEVFEKGTPVKQSLDDYAKRIRSALKE